MKAQVIKFKIELKEFIKSYVGIIAANFFPSIADRFFLLLNKKSSKFFTYHFRPRMDCDFKLKSNVESCANMSIVIQGSLGNDVFVVDTVKIYKRLFPNSQIIVSTWDDECVDIIKSIEDLGVVVILNSKPANRGISNINLQILSTRRGVEIAKKSGSEFVLKVRTDQRLYATNTYGFFKNLLSIFPVSSENARNRIIGVSLNTFMYRMYGLSDMLMFGHVDDIMKFWGVKLDEREPEYPFDANKATLRDFAEWNVCEVYLTTEYLKSVGHTPKWTLEDSLNVFKKYFCIIDKESIDLFWNKYTTLEYRWSRYDLEENVFREISFRDWLEIYLSENNSNLDDEILNRPLV
jgi:hypothetical protein